MIPDHELWRDVVLRKGRAQIILHEIALLLRGINAALPGLDGQGLVLNGEAPDRDAVILHGGDILDVIECPGGEAVRFELAAVDHGAVAFHPRRRRPWRAEKFEI